MSADRQLDAILGRVRYTGPTPQPIEDETMKRVVGEIADLREWQVAHIKAGLAEDEAGGPGVPHEEVVRWMKSWETDHELPMPEPPARASSGP